jgi:hypothetical protein
VELFFDGGNLAAGDDSPPPHYCLRSSSQPLYSPLLRTPRRPRRINLVLETTTEASPPMAGPGDVLEPDLMKLDRILAQLTTITRRLDTHDQHIARSEKF